MRKNNIFIIIVWALVLMVNQQSQAQANSCPELDESAILQVQDCSQQATLCLPVALEDVLAPDEMNITLNGVDYNGGYQGCNFDSIIVYSYFTLLGEGEAGPYRLDAWQVNSDIFSGEFPDIPSLVDSMNIWDPTGDWVQDDSNPNILGGDLSNTYGDMSIEQLQLPGTYATLGLNYGQYALGTVFSFNVGTYEMIIESIPLGCSDTIDITVACTPTEYIEETVYQGLSGTICLDGSELPGTVVSMASCAEDDDSFVDFYPNIVNNCITYNGMMAGGSETACYVLCDDLGLCDTTYITINVVMPPEGEVYVETILVGESMTECLSAEDLMGTDFTISNACPETSGTNVDFTFENGSLCVNYEGLSVGMDTACIVICDDMGGCDSTTFYIAVIDPIILTPIAVDDADTTLVNEDAIVDVLANDTVDFVTSVNIIEAPENGSVYIIMNNQISYEPSEDYCGFDSFGYEVCNAGGCDTAWVEVLVECEEVRVYNGFSPNNDGVNDRFRIGGIESYPDCTVEIYNAWGNMVYQNEKGEGYFNETGWNGTWNGKHLPDGNYFYVINLNDGSDDRMSGYILLHR